MDKPLNVQDYSYQLPQERIALYPLAQRDQSKLLVFNEGKILHTVFNTLSDHLPANSFLFFNDTKVIPARVNFTKNTGAVIEIFLLSPIVPSSVVAEAMQAKGTAIWKCVVGNLKRWTTSTLLEKHMSGITLTASLKNRPDSNGDAGFVELKWNGDFTFAEVIEMAGETPLPPYLKRKAAQNDRVRYQTVYSNNEGAVAAPTAGLHFTDDTFQSLRQKKIEHDFLTLHVSAGTFQPIKSDDANQHIMHQEQIVISKTNIENLLVGERFVIAVGTTSMRTLESLYWFGVKLLENPEAEFKIGQDEPYQGKRTPKKQALEAVLQYLNKRQTDMLIGETSVYIKPGYEFRICQGIVTNFHQPGSTLMLLIAAFVGDHWKQIYQEALNNDYRFLSYGDSSLLIPKLNQ